MRGEAEMSSWTFLCDVEPSSAGTVRAATDQNNTECFPHARVLADLQYIKDGLTDVFSNENT